MFYSVFSCYWKKEKKKNFMVFQSQRLMIVCNFDDFKLFDKISEKKQSEIQFYWLNYQHQWIFQIYLVQSVASCFGFARGLFDGFCVSWTHNFSHERELIFFQQFTAEIKKSICFF